MQHNAKPVQDQSLSRVLNGLRFRAVWTAVTEFKAGLPSAEVCGPGRPAQRRL